MIKMYSIENIHDHGWMLPQILACRYRSFVERQSYVSYPLFDSMEHDEYDTPATVYLAWLDSAQNVRATVRLNPTDRPYMLKDKFSHMIQFEPAPQSSRVLEGSRICIDKSLPPDQRTRAKNALVLGFYEYGLHYGVDTIIGLMQTLVMRRVYGSSGCEPSPMGETQVIGDQRCLAAKMTISEQKLKEVRLKLGIRAPVISNLAREQRIAA